MVMGLKMYSKRIFQVLAALSFALCLCLCAVPVTAGTIILDFTVKGDGAALSFNNTTHVLSGSSIIANEVDGINTPLKAGDHAANGILSFTTPALTHLGNEWIYSGAEAGTFTITGTVPDAGINSPVILLSGNISYIAYTPFSTVNSIVFALGTDTKDADLLAYFGLTADLQFAFNGTVSFTKTNKGWYASGDIANSTEVPEPASLILLGIGLLLVNGYLSCRRK
jgi:hypothetical protein